MTGRNHNAGLKKKIHSGDKFVAVKREGELALCRLVFHVSHNTSGLLNAFDKVYLLRLFIEV